MNRTHRLLAMAAAALGLGAAAADLRPVAGPSELAAEIDAERDHISALQLAEKIMARDRSLMIFDLRSPGEYEEFHIPSAARATLADLASRPIPRESTIVLYSEGGAHSAQAWVLMRMRGYRNVYFLREGLYEWISRVREPRLAIDATSAERAEFARAAELSRFFGGVPLSDVPRGEVPVGYWTNGHNAEHGHAVSETQQAVARVRRRGC